MSVSDSALESKSSLIVDGHLAVALWFALASAIMVALVSVSYFDVPLTLIAASLGVFLIFRWMNVTVSWLPSGLPWVIVAAVAVGVLLRLDVYPNLMGGQDQGLYTNMAELLLNEKSVVFTDAFRQMLTPELQSVFDQSPMSSVTPLGGDQFTIDFYPLHPAWMAVVSWLLGGDFRTTSLLVFSLLGFTAAYHLTRELFQNEFAARVAVLLFAINPALAFFAKFPVAETVATAFALNGFLFWLRCVRADHASYRRLCFVIGALSFNALFYARPQFVIYLPFFLAVMAGCVIPVVAAPLRVRCFAFAAVVMLAFVLSLIYYWAVQRLLFEGIFAHVEVVLAMSQKYLAILIVLVGAGLVAMLLVYRQIMAGGVATATRIQDYWVSAAPYLVLLAAVASIPSIIAIYTTGSLAPFDFQVPTGDDPWLVRFHVLYRWAQFVSPIGLLLLIALPALRLRWGVASSLCIVFLATSWIVVLVQPVVPYLYYYGRYLVSEIVPVSLIIMSGSLALLVSKGGRERLLGYATLVVVAGYSLLFSAVQYGHVESERTQFFAEVERITTARDVLVFPRKDDRLTVAMRVSYARQVFALPATDVALTTGDILRQLGGLAKSTGGRVVVASPALMTDPGSTHLGSFGFAYGLFTNGEHIHDAGVYSSVGLGRLALPFRHMENHQTWHFYALSSDDVVNDSCTGVVDLALGGGFAPDLLGFSVQEAHGRWSDGPVARFRCRVPEDRPRPSTVTIDAMAFIHAGRRQHVRVSVNNSDFAEFDFDEASARQSLKLEIPPDLGPEVVVEFEFPTAVSPAELGLSGDTRKIGVSVRRFTFQ